MIQSLFILKITFSEGEYKKGLVICDDYRDLSYKWFITPRLNLKSSNDIFLRFIAKDSILYMNLDLNVTSENKKKIFYLHCLLIPKKEIDIDKKHHLDFVAVTVSNDDKINYSSNENVNENDN